MNNRFVSIPHWFVGKALFFFEYNLNLVDDQSCGSLYAFVEVMKSHKTSPCTKKIPMVQPFTNNETKKHAILDVADIRSIVGLLQKVDIKNKTPEATNWFYVVSPSTSFDNDMAQNAGKLSDLL